jgi:hypothetical protein
MRFWYFKWIILFNIYNHLDIDGESELKPKLIKHEENTLKQNFRAF